MAGDRFERFSQDVGSGIKKPDPKGAKRLGDFVKARKDFKALLENRLRIAFPHVRFSSNMVRTEVLRMAWGFLMSTTREEVESSTDVELADNCLQYAIHATCGCDCTCEACDGTDIPDIHDIMKQIHDNEIRKAQLDADLHNGITIVFID